MSLSDIVGTPIHLIVNFNRAHPSDEDAHQPDDLDLATNATARALLLAMLPPSVGQSVSDAVTKPLDARFDDIWTAKRDFIGSQIQGAIGSAAPGAYNIFVVLPDKGTLRAEVVNGIAFGLLDSLPPGTTGKQINLSYFVPGINGIFDKPTDSIFGSWADPTISFSFDGSIDVFIAIPDNARIAVVDERKPVRAAVRVEFNTHNFSLGIVPNLGTVIYVLGTAIENLVTQLLTGNPGPPPPGDQTVPIADPDILNTVATLSGIDDQGNPEGVVAAANFGFVAVDPFILIDANGNNAVALRLTHPFDDAPFIINTTLPPVPSIIRPMIGTSVPVVNAGGPLTVVGNFFPLARASQLAITWNDTTTANVTQSEVEWGQYAALPPSPPGPPTIPSSPNDVLITRTNKYDGNNNFRTPKNLIAGTWYGFRARDWDLSGLVASHWSPWTAFQTAASDAVEIRIEYALTKTVLGTVNVSDNGDFSINVTIPAAVPPGTYPIWASMGGQDMAFAPIRVLAAGATLPATLQFINPTSGIPVTGLMTVEETYTYTLQGLNFAISVPVQLYLDTAGGTPLGQGGSDNTGFFKTTITWPRSVLSQHTVVAVDQQNNQAVAAVFAEMLPR